MLGLPFWMLYQFNLAVVYGLRDLIAVLTQAIFLWTLHLPELIHLGRDLIGFALFAAGLAAAVFPQ